MRDVPRLVSLLPSATEILEVLGLSAYQVGRSHECDYPAAVSALPVCTAPKFDPIGTSAEIHDRVTDLLTSALSVYRVSTEQLQELQPSHIFTQAQCEVCAVSLADVEAAVAANAAEKSPDAPAPQVISLQPNTLAEVWVDIRRVAEAVLGSDGVPKAEAAIAALSQRVEAVKAAIAPQTHRPQVACIEWPDPLMGAGNWIPELVTLAGGDPCFGTVGQHSPWLSWSELIAADPDIIILMPCGYDLPRTRAEAQPLIDHPQWSDLAAVRQGQVYVTDGNQYFNRPGPRLVDSLEILAEILHPEAVSPHRYQGHGWQLL